MSRARRNAGTMPVVPDGDHRVTWRAGRHRLGCWDQQTQWVADCTPILEGCRGGKRWRRQVGSWPVVSSHKRQHGMNCGRLDHQRECLPKINTRPLVEPTDDPTCLVSREGAVWIHLVLEDPFVGDDPSTWRPRDKSPSVVGLQCIKFGLHCSIPMGIFDSGANAAGNRQYCLRGHEGVLRVGLGDPGACTSHHRMSQVIGGR
jgi:hypothetical protein